MQIEKITKILYENELEVMQVGTELVLVGFHPHFNQQATRAITHAELRYVAKQLYKKAAFHYDAHVCQPRKGEILL